MAQYGFDPAKGSDPNLTRSINLAFNALGAGNLEQFANLANKLAESLNRDSVATKDVNKALKGMIAELGPAIQTFQGLNAVTAESAQRFAALSNTAFLDGTSLRTQLQNLRTFGSEMEKVLRLTADPKNYYQKTMAMGTSVAGIPFGEKGEIPTWGSLSKQQRAAVEREANIQAQYARQATLIIQDITATYARTLADVQQNQKVISAEQKIQEAEEKEITKLKAQIKVESSKEVQEHRKLLQNIKDRQVLAEQAEKIQRDINASMIDLQAQYRLMGISLRKAGFSQQNGVWMRNGIPLDQNTLNNLRGSLADMQAGRGYSTRSLGENIFAATQARYQMPASERAKLAQHFEERFGVISSQAGPRGGTVGTASGVPTTEAAGQHLFARTAVALTVLYSAQRVMSDTLRIARSLEETTGRIQAITGQIYPGQDFISNRLLLGDRARSLGRQYGRQAPEMADAFETVFQAADMPTRQGTGIAGLAARMAQATGQSVQTITNILMGARNAFRLYGDDLLAFSDQLMKTWADGVLTFEEAERGLGKVFQVARNVGFTGIEGPNSLQAVMAMVAASTKMAGSPSQNMTMLSRFLTEMARPQVVGKLAQYGIGYDPTKPYDTFEGIMSAEKAWRASGKGSFIQGSGVFGRELARRGGAALYAQLPYIQEQLTELGDSSGYLEHAFSKTMDTTTARANRLSAAISNINSLVGDDLLHVIDSIIRPTNAWMDALERLRGINPLISTASDSLRVFQELSTSVLMSSMLMRAGGMLLGVNTPTINIAGSRGSSLGGMMRNLPGGMMANLGMQGYGIMSALTGLGANEETQAAYARDLNYMIAHGNMQGARQSRMPGTNFNPLMTSQLLGPLIALAGIDLIGKNYGQNMLRWAGEKQHDVEDQMFQYRGLLDFRRDLQGAESFDEARMITNQFSTAFDSLAEKYGISADEFITVNGKLIKSFDEFQKMLDSFNLASFEGEYTSLLEKIEVAAAAQERAVKHNYWATLLSRSLGAIPGAIGEAGNLITRAFTPEAALPLGETFSQAIGETQYLAQLREVEENRLKQEELIEKERERTRKESDTEAQETERIAALREESRETIRKILDEYKDEAEALAKQSQVRSKIAGHTDEQAKSAREIAIREKAIEAAMKVMESDVGEASGVLLEVLGDPDYAEFSDIFAGAIEQMTIMEQTLKDINETLESMKVFDSQLSNAFQAYDYAKQQSANRAQTYNSTMLALMGMTGSMFEGPAGELASILIGTTGSGVQTSQAMRQFQTSTEGVDLALQKVQYDKERARKILEAEITTAAQRGSPLSPQEIAFKQTMFEQEWSGQGLLNKQRGAVQQMFPAASSIQQGLMGQLSSVYQYANWAQKYSGIDPKTGEPRGIPIAMRGQVDNLLTMLESEFGKDPVSMWAQFKGSLSPDTQGALWKMDGGFAALDDFFNMINTDYGGSLSKAINTDPAQLANVLATLRTQLESANELNPGGDWLQNWMKINERLDELNVTTINDILENFDNVEEASDKLATTLNDIATKITEIDFAEIVKEAVEKVKRDELVSDKIEADRLANAKLEAEIAGLDSEIASETNILNDLRTAPSGFSDHFTKTYKEGLEAYNRESQFPSYKLSKREALMRWMRYNGYPNIGEGTLDAYENYGQFTNTTAIEAQERKIKALRMQRDTLSGELIPLPAMSTGGTGNAFIDSLGLPPVPELADDKALLKSLLDDPSLRTEIIRKAEDNVDKTCAYTASTILQLVYPWMKNNPAMASSDGTGQWLLNNAEKFGYKATRIDRVEDMQLGDWGVFHQNGTPVHSAISRGGNNWWSNQRFEGERGSGKSPFMYGVHLEPIEQAAVKQDVAATTQYNAAITMQSAASVIASSIGVVAGSLAGKARQLAVRPPGVRPRGIVDASTGLQIPGFESAFAPVSAYPSTGYDIYETGWPEGWTQLDCGPDGTG